MLLKVRMMQDNEPSGPQLVSNRTMEIATAIFFLTVSAIVITDALRLGISWNFDGPAAGYFPFYIACIMGGSSLINLFQAFANKEASQETFVSVPAMGKVLLVLIPLLFYIGAIQFVGIYVASAIYIVAFMWWFGNYKVYQAVPVGVGISFVLFMLFEVWFLTPLPKGPLELWLGY
jgi:putative tricarboxylic transport membrane protein